MSTRKRKMHCLLVGLLLGIFLAAHVSEVFAEEGKYEVVSPLGRSVVKRIPLSSRIPTLEGKKIGLVWTVFANGDVLANAFADLLAKRFKGTEFVKLPPGKGLVWGNYPEPSIRDVVKEAKVDAVIVTVGG